MGPGLVDGWIPCGLRSDGAWEILITQATDALAMSTAAVTVIPLDEDMRSRYVKWLAEHEADEKDRRAKELQDHPLIGRTYLPDSAS